MSAQKQPTCLEQLQKQVEDEAQRTSEKYRSQKKQDDEQVTKASPKKEDQEEVRLNIKPEQPILKSSNIFIQPLKQEPKINIFANSKSINLFNLSQQSSAPKGLNIFTKAIAEVPSVAAKEDDDLSENSEGVDQAHQQLKQPAEHVMMYTYENRFEKLGEFKLVKFRAGEGALKEGMIVSLEKDPKQGQILYFFLKSQATKVVVYKAMLLPRTKLESFSNKKENVKLTVIKIGQEKQGQRELVKLQFENEEASKKFQDIVTPPKKE